MSERLAAGPVLVHFFDYAQLNSVRSLPYVSAWASRYGESGLSVIGVHSPRFPFTRERPGLERAVQRLGISHPIADDGDHAIWHDYGCEGWPSLFLWGRGGALRWFHFGEGEYEATELAIQQELAGSAQRPPPLKPIRATDAPGVLVRAPTSEVLPGGSLTEPWTGGAEPLEVAYEAGGAWAAVDGSGRLDVSLDGAPGRSVPIEAPGLYELASHPRHEHHLLRVEAVAGVRIWAVSFAAGMP
jgi:hypothetical protein